MIKRALPWVAFAAVAAALALAGFWLLFTTFMVYDDEGYVLLSLKNFSEHGGLYDQVYSQYGPFFYLIYDALHHALGFAFTNTTGRWITLINWLGTAAACAALVGRQTRSALWAGFTLAGVFTYLWTMINEPVHPGGFIAFLVALGAWLGAELWETGRIRSFAILTGLISAALMLTKINVGIFFAGAAFAWLALNTARPQAARTLTWLVAAGCAFLPFVLMKALFDAPWVHLYALVFTGGALAVLLTARGVARPTVGAQIWIWFAGVIAATLALTCALTLIRGTTPFGLLDGILLEPFKHPNVYFFPMRWRIGTGVLALASLAVAAWSARNGWLKTRGGRRTACLCLLIAGAAFLCAPLKIIPTSLAAWGMCYGVTLAWLCVVPLDQENRGAGTRAWLALLLVFQFLHAYPVAGSQVNWGTYLWIPLLALGLHNTGPLFTAWFGRWSLRIRLLGALVIAVTTLTMTREIAQIGWSRYPTSQPLNLPGAENVRLPDDMTYALRVINQNLLTHADLLFSFPGIYSVNLWTGLPTPSLANATHWFSLLSPERQQAIITRMDQSPRAVLLVQRDVLEYLARTGFHSSGPLHEWLITHFERAFAVNGYEFWVHRGRSVAALSTARFAQGSTPASQELTVTLSSLSRPVASIQICNVNVMRLPLIFLDAKNTSATIEPIDLAGHATGPARTASFPLAFTGLNNLILQFDNHGTQIFHGQALVVFRDAAGSVITEAYEQN